MTPALLFSILNLMTLAAWLALVFLPRLLRIPSPNFA